MGQLFGAGDECGRVFVGAEGFTESFGNAFGTVFGGLILHRNFFRLGDLLCEALRLERCGHYDQRETNN